MESNQHQSLNPDPLAVESHIEFYENKATNELKEGKFEEAAQSYASAAKICQSLEDLENAQFLFAKSSRTFRNIDPQKAHNMFVQARKLSEITGLTFDDYEQQQRKEQKEQDNPDNPDSSDSEGRDCRSFPECIVDRLKSCFDKK